MADRMPAIDRRQRVAAAILLAAIDLPAPMDVVGRLWGRAAAVCPGITVDELPIGQSRRVMLTAARNLIDEMLGDVTHG